VRSKSRNIRLYARQCTGRLAGQDDARRRWTGRLPGCIGNAAAGDIKGKCHKDHFVVVFVDSRLRRDCRCPERCRAAAIRKLKRGYRHLRRPAIVEDTCGSHCPRGALRRSTEPEHVNRHAGAGINERRQQCDGKALRVCVFAQHNATNVFPSACGARERVSGIIRQPAGRDEFFAPAPPPL